jgi:hypothetical protein
MKWIMTSYQEVMSREYRDLTSQLHFLDLNTLDNRYERLAFWINLYNALVIDAIIQFGILSSVTEKPLGVLSFFQRAAYIINEQRFSLTDIEHGILRGNRGFPYFPGVHFESTDPRKVSVIPAFDPRIHFVLNCASKSCPPIGVYSPDRLDVQLDLASRSFINMDMDVDKVRKTISLSSIFRWYKNDFSERLGILEFLIQYVDDKELEK